ncbi:hypothetical protein [Flavobacterium sp.]|uniref:hypothetical protein n=1 Tax=Flavobacterium sp. TaxID=239 RepID=UPI002B4B1935|nr:hypothetical protein [Flavobacterium sp.]HLP64215.1 hypothetical protein [Flavobacterium sp.]
MKKCLLIVLVSLFQFSCRETISDETTEKAQLKPYAELKEELKNFKGDAKEKQDRFFTFINTDVPNYWMGTKWDFNGTTRTPQNGTIACGYFVTTVLDDFGIKLKRIQLAQQVSSVMIKTLCESKSIKHFSKIEQVETYLNGRNKEEIFIVGLDFHTGFIIKDQSKLYFLHSNYIQKEGVVKEEIRNSRALLSSKSFMIGSVSQKESNF